VSIFSDFSSCARPSCGPRDMEHKVSLTSQRSPHETVSSKVLQPLWDATSGKRQAKRAKLFATVLIVVVVVANLMSCRGIPYAAPPVGDLRLRSPQPPLNWSGILNASTFGANCHQVHRVPCSVLSLSVNLTVRESVRIFRFNACRS